jgi:uncharacterized protein YjbI with pentapeptide repeats
MTARSRKLAVLTLLDRDRKNSILRFLYEAQVINRRNKKLGPDDTTEFKSCIVGLDGADLRNANLRYLTLEEAALDGAILENADLRNAQLSRIDLGGAFLSGADLRDANLSEARLVNAKLQRKDELNLKGANLSGADLSNANLSGANLKDATAWNEEQLKQTESLEGATMPDGQKYEDWLKDK